MKLEKEMVIPEIYNRIMGIFDPEIFDKNKNFIIQYKEYLGSINMSHEEIDVFVDFIDEVTDERNTEEYCERVWKSSRSRLWAMPGQFRGALRNMRDLVAGLKDF